ncbi:MAG TPA: signal peptide peptidase SppA [Phycisphaeraceae bacterium]
MSQRPSTPSGAPSDESRWRAAPALPPPPRSSPGLLGRVARSLVSTLLLTSLALNAYLGFLVYSMTSGPSEAVYLKGDKHYRIVILPVDGLISDGTYQFIREALLALREDLPEAVILRVDSGGGYVTPSDQIWHELQAFKEETGIPLIASFGSTAASGGYYVASPADLIVAEPTTITGSIGVIAEAFTIDGLLGKVGVTPEVIASTESTKKDMLSPMRPWTEQDRQKLRELLDQAYARFVEVVYQGRASKLSREQVHELATGEVFTAEAAQDLGLVDQIGYLDQAIEAASSEAGIPAGVEPLVTVMRQPHGLGLLGLVRSPAPQPASWLDGRQVRQWALELSQTRLAYRLSLVGR